MAVEIHNCLSKSTPYQKPEDIKLCICQPLFYFYITYWKLAVNFVWIKMVLAGSACSPAFRPAKQRYILEKL